MALEPDKKDRSYQYGRLLAIMEKIENDTYSDSEDRTPNALRKQMYFVQRPATASANILSHLRTAYYPRLSKGSRTFYDRIISEIFNILSEFDDVENNKPLKETYLMGYYLQKYKL